MEVAAAAGRGGGGGRGRVRGGVRQGPADQTGHRPHNFLHVTQIKAGGRSPNPRVSVSAPGKKYVCIGGTGGVAGDATGGGAGCGAANGAGDGDHGVMLMPVVVTMINN